MRRCVQSGRKIFIYELSSSFHCKGRCFYWQKKQWIKYHPGETQCVFSSVMTWLKLLPPKKRIGLKSETLKLPIIMTIGFYIMTMWWNLGELFPSKQRIANFQHAKHNLTTLVNSSMRAASYFLPCACTWLGITGRAGRNGIFAFWYAQELPGAVCHFIIARIEFSAAPRCRLAAIVSLFISLHQCLERAWSVHICTFIPRWTLFFCQQIADFVKSSVADWITGMYVWARKFSPASFQAIKLFGHRCCMRIKKNTRRLLFGLFSRAQMLVVSQQSHVPEKGKFRS